MKKQVTITLQGYNHEQIKPLLLKEFFSANPKANIKLAVLATGLSYPTVKKIMDKTDIRPAAALSKREQAFMERLKKKGFTISAPTASTRTRMRLSKAPSYDFTPLLNFEPVLCKGLKVSSVRTYLSNWQRTQTGLIRCKIEQTQDGVMVTRTK